ncbi:hypothetical protein Gpo141_00001915 [Globisporangium polare]
MCDSSDTQHAINASASTSISGSSHSARNATTDRFRIGLQSCSAMDVSSWGGFKDACQWNHGSRGFSIFFVRHDTSVMDECTCHTDLESSNGAVGGGGASSPRRGM